jgi:hypothetical protein
VPIAGLGRVSKIGSTERRRWGYRRPKGEETIDRRGREIDEEPREEERMNRYEVIPWLCSTV